MTTNKPKQIQFGDQYTRLSEEEKWELRMEKNGVETTNNELEAPTGRNKSLALSGLNYSYTGGIAKDPWMSRNPEVIQLVNLLETTFVKLFEWEGLEPEFRREMESILFRFGTVALVKLPTGEIYPVRYTFKDDTDRDFYGVPLRIQITTLNAYNGAEFDNTGEEKQFVILYNNHKKTGTIEYLYERIRQWARSIRHLDNNSVLSAPKWIVGVSADDASWIDIWRTMTSDSPVVPGANNSFRKNEVVDVSGADRFDSLSNTVLFQFSLIIKLVGLKANSLKVKAERQTELEVAREDELNLIIEDMFDRRDEMVEMMNSLGLSASIIKTEDIEGEDPQKDEVNGEENKKIEEGDE